MIKRKRVRLLLTGALALPVIWFFATAHYGSYPIIGVHYISRPPIATFSWGPARAYIVSEGVNAIADHGVGAAGNVFEFPVSSSTRVALRLFSVRWFREELDGWASNHRKIAGWLGYRGEHCSTPSTDTGAATYRCTASEEAPRDVKW